MPISNIQHRNIAGNDPSIPKPTPNVRVRKYSSVSDETLNLRQQLIQVENSHEVLNRRASLNISTPCHTAISLLLLISQCRLIDSAHLEQANYPALASNRNLPSDTSAKSFNVDSSDFIIHSTVSPHEENRFVAQLDPLRFTSAQTSALPHPTQTKRSHKNTTSLGNKNLTYILNQENEKKELISVITQQLVESGQLALEQRAYFEFLLRSESANEPIIISHLSDNTENSTSRNRRALLPHLNPHTGEHIKENCAFEEEILNVKGEHEGKILLFEAQRIENPFRMLYDNTDSEPSPTIKSIADILNLGTNILTIGIKPFISNIIANAKRREYYKNNDDPICTERYRRIITAEFLTSLDVALPNHQSFPIQSTKPIIKPIELSNIRRSRERAAFYTKDPHTEIRKEILLELKEHKKAVADNIQPTFLKPTDKPNEFITHQPSSSNTPPVERTVIADESGSSWHYADPLNVEKINVIAREGKKQVKLLDNYYDLQKSISGGYEVIIQKENAIKVHKSVYMEPLSKTWHLHTHNEHPVFNNKQLAIIEEIKSSKQESAQYLRSVNKNPSYYRDGHLYSKKITNKQFPEHYIEMNGELLPVRENRHQQNEILYEVFNINKPKKKGYPIEWDGNRWIFEKKTSPHVSHELKNLVDINNKYPHQTTLSKLSLPDNQGLRHDSNGLSYIKIKGKHLALEKSKHHYYLKNENGDKIYIDYINHKFTPLSIKKYSGKLSLHPFQAIQDAQMASPAGLKFPVESPLNKAWYLENITVKNKGNINNSERVGTAIDVTFKMRYNKPKRGKYIEMPALEWNENINLKKGHTKWNFKTDMYRHKPTSKTFKPWLNRYVEAYHYAKAQDKTKFNGNVKIFDINMEPISANRIKNANTDIQKVRSIQQFLRKNGGIMEITITDRPSIANKEMLHNKERNLMFNIGFNGQSMAHFFQGAYWPTNNQKNAFITVSHNIKLAQGDVNILPPSDVSLPKKPYFLSGEIY